MFPGHGEAIVFQNSSLNVTATVGESVVLECAPIGEIYINVTWTPMPSNSLLYNRQYGGVLRIDNVALSNEGVYNCSYIWINPKNMSVVSGSRQYHLAVKGAYVICSCDAPCLYVMYIVYAIILGHKLRLRRTIL